MKPDKKITSISLIIITAIIILSACKKNIQSESGDRNVSVPGSGNDSVQSPTSGLNNSTVSNSTVFGGTGEDNILIS